MILDENLKNNIELIKKVRINNTLSKFSKKDLLEFSSKIDQINVLLMDPNYSSIVSLILDGKIKAKGNEYLLFVYKNNSLEEYFNSEILMVEEIFNKIFKENYKVIAVNSNEWEIIKKEFNNSIKNNLNNYIYQEENFDIKELLNKTDKKEKLNDISKQKNEIENMFEEIVTYD